VTARTAIVTGAASGIGLASARRLAGAGWRVVLVDRDAERLAEVAGFDEALAVAADVTDEAAATESVRRACEAFEAVHALVNCAGIADNAPFLDATVASFRRTVEVNLLGTFLMGQAAARVMGPGGSIVNISSVSGLRGSPQRAAYSASKGGVIALTKVMAVELGPRGIRVNCVAPGATNTPLAASVHDPATRAAILAALPLGRYAEPAEQAEVIAFLAGDGAAFVTGQIWAVDGGQLAGAGWRVETGGQP
jgi:NAD(P)-dependent dehydrogenase (short-subunit alcohol dehydrogenase family)